MSKKVLVCRLARLAGIAAFLWALAGPAAAQTIPREYIYLDDQILAYQASFQDVPPGHVFYTYINAIANLGITGGCGPGLFCPDAPVTREQMAVFLLTAKEGPGYSPPACTTPPFGDVPVSSPFCRWIQELVRRGITAGCGGGNYCPSTPVTREQMSVFLLVTLDPTLNPPACVPPNDFTDVPETSPFCRWIEELSRRGITGGCGPGPTFCPTQPVTRGQMAVFLTVTFSLPQ
jgi:S-layer family protein